VIFLGAGSSGGATRTINGIAESPPNWKKLLLSLHQSTNRGTQEDKDLGRKLIDEASYLNAAEVLRTCIQDGDFNHFIFNQFREYKHSEIHEHINAIDQKVVVTTNYDCIYENYCRQGEGLYGYQVLKHHDEGLVTRLRSPIRLIIKAHGCMTSAENAILTRSDYFSARQKYSSFFQTLESIFLTNTLLFIGYSLTDPDIQLLLENSTITAKSAHPHYAVMPTGTHSTLKAAYRRAYNVEILEYSDQNNHEELTESLAALSASVAELRETNV
jgi:hypothetical protein